MSFLLFMFTGKNTPYIRASPTVPNEKGLSQVQNGSKDESPLTTTFSRVSMHSTMMGSMYQGEGSTVGSQYRKDGSLISGRASNFQRGNKFRLRTEDMVHSSMFISFFSRRKLERIGSIHEILSTGYR